MTSLKTIKTCLDDIDDRYRAESNKKMSDSDRVYTVNEKVRFLESLLLLGKEFPDKAGRICLYVLLLRPIGRGIFDDRVFLQGTSEEKRAFEGGERGTKSISDLDRLRQEIVSLVKRSFSEEKEDSDVFDGQTDAVNECQLLRKSRSILLSDVAAKILGSCDFEKCYRSKKRNWLCCRIDRLKSVERAGSDDVSLFSRYCDQVKCRWIEEQCPLGTIANSLFALYWDVIVRELEILLDRFVTASPSMDRGNVDVNGRRSNARLFGSVSLRSSGEILVLSEDESRHQMLGQCHDTARVKAIVSLAQSCWSLETSMLSALKDSMQSRVSVCKDDDFTLLKSHPYSDYMGSTEPTMNSNWRSLFLPFLGDLIDTIDREICFNTSVAIQEEWELVQIAKATHVIDDKVIAVDSSGRRVLHSVWTLCEASANYLPLAELAGLRLSQLRTSFVEGIRGQCVEIQNHIIKIGRLVPHSASVPILYASLGSILKLKTMLKECCAKLESDGLDQVCYELEKVEFSLSEQVTLYHQDVIATCILQDDEAHNWESSKPFHENECCSFSVQQWYLHLLALRHDLWSAIPSSLSVKIFTRVLENSLCILTCRYSGIRPSLVRTKQMQADIIAILLCTAHLLEFTSSRLSEFYAVTQGVDDSVSQRNIHNLSTSLASALIVVTAPLHALYKVFKKGFVGSDSLKKEGYHWNWLTIGQNNVWRECLNEYDENTTLSLTIRLKLLCNQPTDENWPLLLQVLFGMDHAVARLFLVSPPFVSLTDHSRTSDDVFHPIECFKSLMYILVHLDRNCIAFAEVFLLWMRNNEMKPDFFTDSINARKVAIGMEVISDLLGPLIDSVVEAVVLHLVPFVDLDSNCLRRISKLVYDEFDVDYCEVVIETVELFLGILPASFAFIPDPVCHLFVKLQELEDPSTKKTRHCLAFRFLCAVHGFALSPKEGRSYFATTLKPGLALDIFSQVSKSLLYLGGVNSAGLDISADLVSHLIGLQSSVNNTNESVQNYFALSSENIHPCNPSENLGVIADLPRSSKGVTCLRCLHRILVRFKYWFILSLGQFNCTTETTESPLPTPHNSTFNPFEYFGSIGDTGYTFDQESLVKEIRFDWDRLSKENLFVSEIGFSSLLSRRWEFNLETDLDASNLERKYVTVLRELFVCDS